MHIVHVGAEFAPIAKVGGLADVLLGLGRELTKHGHFVEIVIPKYEHLQFEEEKNLKRIAHIPTYLHGKAYEMQAWSCEIENLSVIFLDSNHPDRFFSRGEIYGYPDDRKRFLHFSRMVFDYYAYKGFPDIFHLHDWQAAVLAPLLHKENASSKVVFTIHNLAYQGIGPKEELLSIGLDSSLADELFDPKYEGNTNLIKGAILFSDFFNTVSPTYAKEVLTEANENHLHHLLLQYQHKFRGILNGIDDNYWNPETDRYLLPYFSKSFFSNSEVIERKKQLKEILRKKVGLSLVDRPIVASITRLVPQKGIELIKHTLYRTIEKGGQFLLLGTTPIKKIEKEFLELKKQFEKHPHVHIILSSPEDLVHLIYAGSDIFIVPSIFEPCGLTQLIALRYGTIPVVRKTGGLSDTIFDIDYSGKDFEKTNGFTFTDPTPLSLNSALDRAIDTWRFQKDRWSCLIKQAVESDYSWKKSCLDYISAYHSLLPAKSLTA